MSRSGYAASVREAQDRLGAIDTDHMQRHADGVHLTAEGETALGYAAFYRRLVRLEPVPAGSEGEHRSDH